MTSGLLTFTMAGPSKLSYNLLASLPSLAPNLQFFHILPGVQLIHDVPSAEIFEMARWIPRFDRNLTAFSLIATTSRAKLSTKVVSTGIESILSDHFQTIRNTGGILSRPLQPGQIYIMLTRFTFHIFTPTLTYKRYHLTMPELGLNCISSTSKLKSLRALEVCIPQYTKHVHYRSAKRQELLRASRSHRSYSATRAFVAVWRPNERHRKPA